MAEEKKKVIRYSKIKSSEHYEDIEKVFNKFYGKIPLKQILKYVQEYEPDVSWSNFQSWYTWYIKNFIDPNDKRKKIAHKTKIVKDTSGSYARGEHDIVWFAENVLGLSLHDGQKEWLRKTTEEEAITKKNGKERLELVRKKNILVPANQFGKTFATAIKHIWYCYYKKGLDPEIREIAQYETMDLSPKLRQVRALYGYVLNILRGEMWWEDPKTGDIKTNKDNLKIKDFLVKPKRLPSTNQISNTPIEFRNGAKMHAASTGGDLGSGLQGGQYPYISYDECPLSNNLEQELPARIMSRLIRYGGSIDLIGTPDDISPSFMYYKRLVDLGKKEKEGWITMFGKLDDNVFIPETNREQIKQAIKTTDITKYRQVVFGEFVRGSNLVFRHELIKKMWDKEMIAEEVEHGSWNILEPTKIGQYVIGVDWAIANDYTVMIVLEYTSEVIRIVHFYRIKGSEKPPQAQYVDLLELKRIFNNADVMMDTNGLGGKLIESEFKDEVGFNGFNFGPGRKSGFISNMQKYLHWNNEGKLKSAYLPTLDEELGSYVVNDTKIRQDCVMALGLALWYIDQDDSDLPDAIPYY